MPIACRTFVRSEIFHFGIDFGSFPLPRKEIGKDDITSVIDTFPDFFKAFLSKKKIKKKSKKSQKKFAHNRSKMFFSVMPWAAHMVKN